MLRYRQHQLRNKGFTKMKFFIAIVFLLFSTESFAKSVLDIQHWQTKQGAQVYFVQTKQLPMVDVQVVFNAGSARDGKLFGIANLTNELLSQGTKALNADQIALQFESLGAIYDAGINRDMASLRLRSLSEAKILNPAIKTFAQVLTSANFPTDALQRTQKQILIALQQEQQTPTAIARNEFYKALYGEQPYGHSMLGSAETVARLTANDLQKFYQQYYVAKNAVIAIVGDLTEQKAHDIAEQITAGLPIGNVAEQLPSPVPPIKSLQKSVAFPAKQTTVLIGQIGMAEKDPDYFPLYVGNYILGGGQLVSRLFDEVRSKNGLVYQVGSQFKTLQVPGPFVVPLQTRQEQAQRAVQLTRKVLGNFVTNGPTEKELVAAKKNIIGSFPLGLASNDAILDNLIMIGFYQLPLDYLDTYRQKVDAVTVEQIRDVFKRRIHLDQMITIMVG